MISLKISTECSPPLDEMTDEIHCDCGHKIVLPLSQMRPGMSATCPKCSLQFNFSGDDLYGLLEQLESQFS